MTESRGASLRTALLAVIAIAVILAVGYWTLRPATPPPEPSASASPGPVAAATPGIEPAPEAPAPTPEGEAKPGAAAKPPQPPRAKRPPAPSPKAGAAAPPLLTPQAMLLRAFVAARSSEESLKGIDKSVGGFDLTGSTQVEVKRAAEVSARLVFYSTPSRVKPGDDFSVKIGLVNGGKKTFEIKEVQVTVLVNDTPLTAATGTVKPLVKKVAPRQEEVIHEIAGKWDKGTRSWVVRVGVLSDKRDVYRNELVWK